MAAKPGFFDYLTAAFNARPIGMFVAPNWVGLGAFGLLGVADPGFWVLGAGLELGYLLALATNERFQRARGRACRSARPRARNGTQRIQALARPARAGDRRIYDALSERCRSIIDLQTAGKRRQPPGGLEAQADSLGRLSWMFLRLLVARRTIRQVHRRSGATARICATRSRRSSASSATESLSDELRAEPRRAARNPQPAPAAAHRRANASSPTSTPSSSASSSRSS